MRRFLAALAVLVVLVTSCQLSSSGPPDLTIISGSENQPLEPIIQEFARQQRLSIQVKYAGSVDIMLGLEDQAFQYDAVWPAHSLWISLGDEKLKRVKHAESIMRSPVVFGIRKSKAQQLGLVGHDVTVADILVATEGGRLRFMMTNATQSNSGATAYLGFIYSFLGQPDVISAEDLDRPDLQAKLRKLLGAVNRSSGSSGWLKDLYLQSDTLYDGMVNYESVIIETNQALVAKGKEPLYVVYPIDGQAIADSPLAYVDRGSQRAERAFLDLQKYLLGDAVQKELQKQGRRVGVVGLTSAEVDKAVFNPDWDIDTKRIINQIRIPQPAVVRKALHLYQVSLKKPSFTVYCLDYSGSMQGTGERALEDAMALLLTPERAESWMLQTGSDDVTVVIPFNSQPIASWRVQGGQPADLDSLLQRLKARGAEGGTDIYLPVVEGLKVMRAVGNVTDRYQPAIILMTDGKSNSEDNLKTLTQEWRTYNQDVPVFAITFGDADARQLDAIAQLTRGRVFDGKSDLVTAFRTAKGYN